MTEQKAKYITNIYNADGTKIDIGDRTQTACKSLYILIDLLTNSNIYPKVVEASVYLKTIQEQIETVVFYKEIHDKFDDLSFVFKTLFPQETDISTQEISLIINKPKNIIIYQLIKIIDDIYKSVNYSPFKNRKFPWLDNLITAKKELNLALEKLEEETDFSRDLFRHSGDRLSSHPPSLILSLPIVIKKRLLRIRLGGKPLFGRAFRNAVNSQEEEKLSNASFLIEFVLNNAPGRVNESLRNTASNLSLKKFAEQLNPVQKEVNDSEIEKDTKNEFKDGIKALEDLDICLNKLIENHDQLQEINTLLQTLAPILSFCWFHILILLKKTLCVSN